MVDQFQLLGRRIHLDALDAQLVIGQVDDKVVVADLLDVLLCAAAASAQDSLDARNDLLGLKRLRHVIVRAELQTEHLVERLALGREHDDRLFGRLADLAADLPAVEAGQHDIQQHQIRLLFMEALQRGLAVVENDGLISVLFQIQPQQLADIGIVVDDHDSFRCHEMILLLLSLTTV